MKRVSTEECDKENLSIFFQEGFSQLNKINQISEDLSVLYNGDSSKLYIL
jgi:hypothetical protein